MDSVQGGCAPAAFPYDLDFECPVPWPPSQEAGVCPDYPFSSVGDESGEDFVIRRYLETLWLPESIMSLHHFIHSLRRVLPTTSGIHPLHVALKPLLLSVRATQEKYHLELPQILHDGGGAGELEEAVMWFAWSKEKFEPDASNECGKGYKSAEEQWKKSWMERLERREVQMQIILYLQLLSLPAPPSTTPVASPKICKRKRPGGPPTTATPIFPSASSSEPTTIYPPPTLTMATTASTVATLGGDVLNLDDRLEYFMDRLSVWQLSSSLNPPRTSQPTVSQAKVQDERDWMQIFCEDVVEPFFKDLLPEQCALLRTKVFPHSPFSDLSDDAGTPPRTDLGGPKITNRKRKRPTSPLRLTELQKSRNDSRQPCTGRAETQEARPPDRHRSRLRSVSVSVEEVRARGASRGGVASSRNLFKDEIEMKRTARKVSRLCNPTTISENKQCRKVIQQNSAGNVVSSAEVCAPRSHSPRQAQEHRTLAADTPVKKSIKMETHVSEIVVDSPDALLLTSETGDGETRQLGAVKTFVMDTPVKKRTRQ